MHGGGRSSSARGQTTTPSSVSSYGVVGSRLEPFDDEERVVMPLDVEGARAVPEHAYLARLRRLDPDRRRLGSDVAEERADEQVGRPGGLQSSARS